MNSVVCAVNPYFLITQERINELKQSALLFNSIEIHSIDLMIKALEEKENKTGKEKWLLAEIKWLMNEKIIGDALAPKLTNGIISTIPPNIHSHFTDDTLIQVREMFKSKIMSSEGYEVKEVMARISAIMLSSVPGVTAIPLISTFNPIQLSRKADVYNIVIDKIPVPALDTPWEKIFDFRNDPNSKGQLAGLRTWISKVATLTTPVNEIEEELEYLLYQYSQALKVHRMKTEAGILQSIVLGAAEAVENALKLKLGEFAKGLFSLRKAKADLLAAELSAPGVELAYIYKTRKQFGGSQ